MARVTLWLGGVDIGPIALVGGDTAGRDVRLHDETEALKLRHIGADGGTGRLKLLRQRQ
jgi:hypothetical protein